MNALLDKDFLKELDNYNSREIYARITALTVNELPIESIEGRVTGGSINIDGKASSITLRVYFHDSKGNHGQSKYWHIPIPRATSMDDIIYSVSNIDTSSATISSRITTFIRIIRFLNDSIILVPIYPQKNTINDLPNKIAGKNFLILILDIPDMIFTAKAGVNGIATRSTKLLKLILSTIFKRLLANSWVRIFLSTKLLKIV